MVARLAIVVALASAGCVMQGPAVEGADQALSTSARAARAAEIRDLAKGHGLDNAAMLAGLASAETGLAHCWSEASWACQGPWSNDCGGPVISGAGDGPCWWKEGGLGLFQLDGGNHDQTLNREGRGVLELDGNIAAGVRFVADMLVKSPYVALSDRSAALRWLSGVRPGGPGYDAWLRTVVHLYNGCDPAWCGVWSSRYGHYDHHARQVWNETGAGFWGAAGPSSPAPSAAVEVAEPAPASDPDPVPAEESCKTVEVTPGSSCGRVESALSCPGEIVNCTGDFSGCGDLWAGDVLACGWDCCP